jgi:pimeloyl-ACP methyl ester carboxylesterase
VFFDHRLDDASTGLEGLVEAALEEMDRVQGKPEPMLVLGESFGGPVALTLARMHPERVSGLLLFSTFAHYPASRRRELLAALDVWSRFTDDRPREAATTFFRRLMAPAQLGDGYAGDLLDEYLGQPLPSLAAVRAKCVLTLEFDARPWLSDVHCPALVLAGDHDPVVPPAAGWTLARDLRSATFHLLPGGHLVHISQAEQAGNLVRAWLPSAVGAAR